MINLIIRNTLLFLLALNQITFSYAQTASLLPNGMQQFFDNNGNPLTSGTVDFYIPNTFTRKNTWQDSGETILNTNPIILDAAGRALIYGDGVYRQILKDNATNLIWDKLVTSNVTGGTIITTGDGDAVGTIKPWAGLLAPNQYVFAFGQEVSRVTFAALLTAITQQTNVVCTSASNTVTGLADTTQIPIGAAVELTCVPAGTVVVSKTTSSLTLNNPANVSLNASALIFPYGNGNGTTTFNIPDLRGYVVAGRDNMGGTAANRFSTFFGVNTPAAIGAKGGNASNTLLSINLPSHNHTIYDPGHTHPILNVGSDSASSGSIQRASNLSNVSATSSATTGIITQNSGGSGLVISATLDAAGSSYTNGAQVLTVSGGTCSVQPSFNVTVAGNIVTTINSIANAGNCSVPPINPVTTTGGGGTGATLNVAFTTQAFATIQPTITLNYIIKVTPDSSNQSASGVASLGGQIGAIGCGSGLLCTGNSISVNGFPNINAFSLLGNSTGSSGPGASIAIGQGLNFLTTSTLQVEPAYAKLTASVSQSASPTVPLQAVDPWGRPITGITPTNSQGFNEFVTVAKNNNWSWSIDGNFPIHTTVQLVIPPCFLRSEYIATGVTIVVDTSLGASDTLVHDTYENCDITFRGSITQKTGDTGYCYSFSPSTIDLAGNIGHFASTVEVANCTPASGGTGIKWSLSNGGMIGVNPTVKDINGGLQTMIVTNPGTAFIAYEHNSWTLLYNHGPTSRCVQIGTSSANQANMRYNKYNVGRMEPGIGNTTCWDSWETYGTYNLNITNETASATIGLKFEAGACGNTVTGGSVLATTALSDGCITSGIPNEYNNVKGISSSYPGTQTNDNASLGSIGEFINSRCPQQNATVTITIASPAVVTYTAHGLLNTGGEADACPIIFTTSGALPTGITSGTTYWTIPASLTTNTTQIATSVINAIAGTPVNTSGSQSGTQTGTFNVGLVTATAKNVTGVALTPGDWDCTGNTLDGPAGSTVVTATNASLNTVTDTLAAPWVNGAYTSSQYSLTGVARVTALSVGRFSFSATTNVYLVANNSFTTSTETSVGILRCRRVR